MEGSVSVLDMVGGAPVSAPFLDAAIVALRTTCLTGVAAVEQEPVVSRGNLLVGEVLGEFLLDGKWGSGTVVDES